MSRRRGQTPIEYADENDTESPDADEIAISTYGAGSSTPGMQPAAPRRQRYQESLCSAPLDARDMALIAALLLRGLERRRACNPHVETPPENKEIAKSSRKRGARR